MNLLYQPLLFKLLISFINADDSVIHDQSELLKENNESAISADDSIILNDLKIKLKQFELENEKLLNENKYLTEKMLKQQKRHQEILFAMSWKYEQLERKAQTYYNSFQTQKQNLGKIVNKYTEPARNVNNNQQSPLIPMYLWSEMNNKRKLEKELEELSEGNYEELNFDEEDDEGNFEAPVARSFNRLNNPLNGVTLKSALGNNYKYNLLRNNEEDSENNSNGVGNISELLQLKKSSSQEHLENLTAKNKKWQRMKNSKRSYLQKKNIPLKFRKLNPIHIKEKMDIENVLEGVKFEDHFSLGTNKKGGIRR